MNLNNFSRIFVVYLIHILTASGVIAGFLALLSVMSENLVGAFLWLGLAFFIDGIDGPLARKFHAEEVTPHISGKVLDHIVDYFNYVIIPSFMIHQLGFVPKGTELLMSIFILLVSSFTFANRNLKTQDNYFEGFPAVWNVVLFYFYILETPQNLNLIFLTILCFLTFIPFKYVHPFRVEEGRGFNIIIISVWILTSLFLLLFEGHSIFIFWLWVVSSLYFLYLSFKRSISS